MHALWPIAVEHGKIAGLNMAGARISYEGDVSRNILTVLGKTIFTGGISKEDKFNVYKKTTNGEYSKIILKEGKLTGFLFTGEVNNPGAYLYIMKNEIEVDKLKKPLLYGTISYSDLHSSIIVYNISCFCNISCRIYILYVCFKMFVNNDSFVCFDF